MDLPFRNQHVFFKLWILEISVPPPEAPCTFGLSTPAHPHKGPRPQNSTKTKHAHTEIAPATLRKCRPGDGATRFQKAPLVYLRPLLHPWPQVCPRLNSPGLMGFVVVKLSGHGLVARNTAACGCSTARWTHGSTLILWATLSSVNRAQGLP